MTPASAKGGLGVTSSRDRKNHCFLLHYSDYVSPELCAKLSTNIISVHSPTISLRLREVKLVISIVTQVADTVCSGSVLHTN